jgi:predicted Fe-S protein YdhL (DUF1289 family)
MMHRLSILFYRFSMRRPPEGLGDGACASFSGAVSALAPSSPCIKVCVVDGRDGTCVGCGRTLGEIAAWSSLDEPARLAIMAALPDRLAQRGEASTP